MRGKPSVYLKALRQSRKSLSGSMKRELTGDCSGSPTPADVRQASGGTKAAVGSSG